MEVTAISGYIGIQARGSHLNAERISTRVIENRDSDGDNRLNVAELGGRAGILGRVDSNGDKFINQEELFAALTRRIEERNGTSIEISFNINVIKANLGSLLSSVLDRTDSDNLTNQLTGNSSEVDDNRLNTNARERYINALITADIDGGGFFRTTNTLSADNESRNLLNPFTTSQNDGGQLLLNLLIEELGTSREDAAAIMSALQSVSFQTVA